MRIGILGSGLMGAKLGTIFARAGHLVISMLCSRSRVYDARTSATSPYQ
jgi:3-hydroxyacyl-CoA dehydrogenase